MNIAIMTELYPSIQNIYSGIYVHARVLEYVKKGHICNIYCLNNKIENTYIFDNIVVYQGNNKFLKSNMLKNKFDLIVMHAPNPSEKYFVINNFPDVKVVCWIHGLDALSGAFTYPYLGFKVSNIVRFVFRLKEDFKKIKSWKVFLNTVNPKIVVVSEWMKIEAEKFLNMKFNNIIKIPNHVDEEVFKFKQRKGNVRKILCIRPHSSSKYAIDLAISSFSNSSYKLDIYGKGPLLKHHKRLAKKCNANVEFIEKFFNKSELSKLFNDYDIAIMPTRLDSQGIMVCEMNISGLPVITSDILGNKEYETKGTIRLKNDKFYVTDLLNKINDNQELEKLSKYAHEDMIRIASKKVIIEKELNVMEKILT